jgi:hypothetical protein
MYTRFGFFLSSFTKTLGAPKPAAVLSAMDKLWRGLVS